MYITFKGIGKVRLASVSIILLICKFLNFTAVFTKKKKTFQSFHTIFHVGKLISVSSIQLLLPFITFEEHYKVLRFYQLSVKVTLKQTVKNDDYWIFLIFFVFTLVFFLEIKNRGRLIVQIVHLYIWAAAEHELTAIRTRGKSFNFLNF